MSECWHNEKKGGGGICKYCGDYHGNVAMHWNFCDKNPEARHIKEELDQAKPITEMSFMPRIGGHPVSRDYAMEDIPCGRRTCICNVGSRCKVPSRCVLDGDGKCTGFQSKGE